MGMSIHVPPAWESYAATNLRAMLLPNWYNPRGSADCLVLVAEGVAHGCGGAEALEISCGAVGAFVC